MMDCQIENCGKEYTRVIRRPIANVRLKTFSVILNVCDEHGEGYEDWKPNISGDMVM